MNRRSLLAGVAASGAAIAGCASIEATVFQESTTPEVPSNPDDPIARATIGSPSDDDSPHRVRLWNRTDDQRSIGLEIDSETATFDGSYDLESDAHVVVTIRNRDEYAVVVSVDDATVAETTLEPSSFDEPCPATELFVLEDGEFESTFEPESDHC
ncbi:hypothetical protein [Haloterrigena salifodinae]|uniref:hypothetical protein n=1 Tax=Haloterrigena salifodinae TaxID=2675099 RepID=UPI000F895B29|nr:hypothetical protein [Haloterrigena salifodinae]